MFMPRLRSFLLRVAALILCSLAVAAAERPRLAVFTDIGGDPDDQQSMVRLLHYANEFDLELLVATAIRTRHVPNGPETRPQLLHQLPAPLSFPNVHPRKPHSHLFERLAFLSRRG